MYRTMLESTRVSSDVTIGVYLIRALKKAGCGHIFGVPGDYTLSFNQTLEREAKNEGVKFKNMCGEEGAGFAADAYARITGLGACLATMNCGSLKLLNAAACCAAERSPTVFIVGTPGIAERGATLMHHAFSQSSYDLPLQSFKPIVTTWTVLNDATTAVKEIDRVISTAMREKRPVFIELPRDMVNCLISTSILQPTCQSSPAEDDSAGVFAHSSLPSYIASPAFSKTNTDEAVQACCRVLLPSNVNAKWPCVAIVAGVEVTRFGCQSAVLELCRLLPSSVVATSLLGKSSISDESPYSVGVYQGSIGNSTAQRAVEGADVIVLLGMRNADVNLKLVGSKINLPGTSNSSKQVVIHLINDILKVGNHIDTFFEGISLQTFLIALCDAIETHPPNTLHCADIQALNIDLEVNANVNACSRRHALREQFLQERATVSVAIAAIMNLDDAALNAPITVNSMFEIVDQMIVNGSGKDSSIMLNHVSSSIGTTTTTRRHIHPLGTALQTNDKYSIIADTGDAIFGSLGLTTRDNSIGYYLAPVFYLTMGWAMPAAVGAHFAEAQAGTTSRRSLVFQGDGSYQMTGHEISKLIESGSNAIVFILNNDGYSTQRSMADGSFADLNQWDYASLPYLYENVARTKPATTDEQQQTAGQHDNNVHGMCGVFAQENILHTDWNNQRGDESKDLEQIALDGDFFGDMCLFPRYDSSNPKLCSSRISASKVHTVLDLVKSLKHAINSPHMLHVLEIMLGKNDKSDGLKAITSIMKKAIHLNMSIPAAATCCGDKRKHETTSTSSANTHTSSDV